MRLRTVLEQVKGLIERLAPDPICDDCITERLSLANKATAIHATQELAGSPQFEWLAADCAICEQGKTVIRCRSL